MVPLLWKIAQQLITKLQSHSLVDLKSISTQKPTRVFIVAFFKIAKTWEQPQCPSIGKWVNGL
jgi:hypothetical protein